MKNEQLKKTLEEQGIPPEQVEAILEKIEKEQVNQHLKVSEVTEILQKELDGVWNEAKVRRFIAAGELPTVNTVDRKAEGQAASTKHGYRVKQEDLDVFIEEQKMSPADWKAKAKFWEVAATERQRIIQELQAEIEQLKNPSMAVEEAVSDAPEGQLTIEEVQEGSMEGEDNKNAKTGHPGASGLTKERAKELISPLSDKPEEILGKLFGKKKTIKWFYNGLYKNPLKLREQAQFETEEEAMQAAVIELTNKQ